MDIQNPIYKVLRATHEISEANTWSDSERQNQNWRYSQPVGTRELKRLKTIKVSGNNRYQECFHRDFHHKHYFINLLVDNAWDNH